jgi:phosphoglycerate dehydrogenase-like enzyme
MKKLNVLFLPPAQELAHPWQDDVVEAIGDQHRLTVFDPSRSLESQFRDIQVVVDFGGSMGTRPMADVAASVLLWQVLGNGIDHFDLEYFRSRNIRVANCPGENTAIPLAEHALMFMLQLSRGWHQAEQNLHKGVMYKPLGCELAGKTLGLIGFGATGRQLSQRANAFEMRVIAVDKRKVSAGEKRKFGVSRVLAPESLDELLQESDYVSVHLHLTPETRHIINAQRLSAMKRGSFLINVSRGALVDEKALAEALASGHLAGAGFDVFAKEPPGNDNPLLSLENVVATPHIAGLTSGTSKRRAAFAAINVNRIASGLEPLSLIATRADVAVFTNLSELRPPDQQSEVLQSDER